MIKLKDLLTEGKISSDVERAARKLGIKFKKDTKVVTTNKFSNPTGDVSKMGKDNERVRMNSWMADSRSGSDNITKQNVKEIGEKFIKLLKSKFKLIKYDKLSSGGYAKFMKDKKNIRTEFVIQYATTMAGPYISYTGVYGE